MLSTIPQLEPDVANCRLTLVGPGCSANCSAGQPRQKIQNRSAKDEAPTGAGRTHVRIPESKILSKSGQSVGLRLGIRFDDE